MQLYSSTLSFAADLLGAATGGTEQLVVEAGQPMSCCRLVHKQVLAQRWARNMRPVPYMPSPTAGSMRTPIAQTDEGDRSPCEEG